MDSLAQAMSIAREVRFDDIEGVGACGVEGHAGRVLEGTVEGRPCTLVMGRRHVYEGDPSAVVRLIEWLSESGVTDLVMASAVGALHRQLGPGDLVVVRDVIDMQNRDRLARWHPGAPVTVGERLSIDRGLRAAIERAATAARVPWQRGTMVCGVGPAYETESEVGVFQRWGGDVATMSSAPELAAAGRLGIRAAAVALVTNPCTGVAAARPHHDEVLRAGARAAPGLVAVIRQLIVA